MDITTIIEAAAALVAAVTTAVVIPYIKSRTTAQQQAEINAWVKIAVTAAEQIYRGAGAARRRSLRPQLGWRSTASPWTRNASTRSLRPPSTNSTTAF